MGKLAEIKTKETNASVKDFIGTVAGDQKQKDSFIILKMMEKATGEKAKMWGSSIIGFGNLVYESPATGRQVEWFRVGFSPRKANITIYLMDLRKHADALKKLGKHKTGGGCLYINKLEDVDTRVLEKMIAATVLTKNTFIPPVHKDIQAYNKKQSRTDRAICYLLAAEINRHLTGTENKIWHAHPVWFLDGNPIVGYSKLKDCIRLLFWSGQSFEEDGLKKEGRFKAAEARYTSVDEVNVKDLARWLKKSKKIQWDYKNIVKRKGVLERLK